MRRIAFAAIVLLLTLGLSVTGSQEKTDDEIRQELIRQSIASYPGNCPCPYNRDRAGRRCGGRSAYSRPGGAAPLCYESDVPQAMVDAYRARLKARERR